MWSVSRVPSLPILALVLLLSSGVAAQNVAGPDVRLEVEDVPDGLTPGGAAENATIRLLVSCEPPKSYPAAEPPQYHLTASTPATGVRLEIVPASLTLPPHADCANGAVQRVEARLQLLAATDAPVADPVRIEVEATRDGEDVAILRETVETIIGYRHDVTVTLERSEWKAGPNSRVSIPVRVDNHGNAPVVTTFRLADDTSPALNVALPAPEVAEQGQTIRTLLEIQTPFENGFIHRNDTISFIAITTFAYDEAVAEEHRLQAEIETVGSHVPGPAPLVMALALLGLAAHARRGTAPKR